MLFSLRGETHSFSGAVLLLAIVLLSGCSINHHVAADYDQYLVNNQKRSNLPETDMVVDYQYSEQTERHRYEFRAATVGYANLWIVEFGKILDSTLRSQDVQSAFKEIHRASSSTSQDGFHLIFDLTRYEFIDYGAHVELVVSLLDGNMEVFQRQYAADGKTQGVKMWSAGVFGMKNAIQQSTKLAIDEILRELLTDLNAVGLSSQTIAPSMHDQS